MAFSIRVPVHNAPLKTKMVEVELGPPAGHANGGEWPKGSLGQAPPARNRARDPSQLHTKEQ